MKRSSSIFADIETLAEFQHRLQTQAEPPKLDPEEIEYWSPSLGLAQQEVFDSRAAFILAHGERYSGKTVGVLNKLVRHAWTFHAAHVLIIVGVKRQATAGGAWTKLIRDILPQWAENLEGFSFENPRMTQEKDVIVECTNQFGTKSVFHLVSIPHGGKLADRIRGIEPTAVFIDELYGIGGPEYFTAIVQQLGRRVDVPLDEQFYIAATNPGGPSHWIYKTFFEAKLADGSPDPKFHVVHVPISQNPDPRAVEYYERNVIPAVRNDPIEYARMVEGKWVDRPSGDALFAGFYVPAVHQRGNLSTGEVLHPRVGRTITLGYDLGDVNHAVIFLQERFTPEKSVWTAFDELVSTEKYVSIEKLVPQILDLMNFWCEEEQHHFVFEHISDKSAFNRFRAASGSFDHQQVETISAELLKKFPKRWPWLKVPIRMKECPKPPGSVAARIKVCRDLFSQDSLYLSARCVKLSDSFANLESKKDEPFMPAKGPRLHPYDAATYALYYHSTGATYDPPPPEEQLKPQVTAIGS